MYQNSGIMNVLFNEMSDEQLSNWWINVELDTKIFIFVFGYRYANRIY
ncbi:hypothetical protein [Desulfosporosinus sp. SB140]